MVLKNVFAAALGTGLLMLGSAALADEYRAGELFGLDPSQAMLSPKRLGPETRFAPVRIEARTDRKQVKTERVVVPEVAAVPKTVAPKTAAPKTAAPKTAAHKTVAPKTHVAHERVQKPRSAARTKLAQRHSNPLDAQARDMRIQTWPCNSGGICDWQR
ncbi:class I SAM-dependent methyltransferase [Bradyrhizobium australiense]|uniref:Uncharacterized protein n=1 Tax=Bradyrhizobium australiense TaxID=2721161 RepID=A0A7Y4LU42_9BRAD|nr:class I SAM-dependent methyltransferase [Bradyrhizobium australiense]NOJ38355.1 hypothetical protein [Bradyrhizobium australiense]